jgi:hypothetical protein
MQLGEMKGYKRNIKKEVNDLILKFIWDKPSKKKRMLLE